jgi:asparagine synthase (glutamine-hydrolysing)
MSRISGATVKTFSVGFEREGAHIDETDEAHQVANFLGTDHTRVVVTGQDFRDKITHIASALDQPSVDGVNSYFISMTARRAVTVSISGTGGDELFAGYPWFVNMVKASDGFERHRLASFVKGILAQLARHEVFDSLLMSRFGAVLDRVRIQSDFIAQYARQYQIFGPLGACKLLTPELKELALMGRDPFHDIASGDELPFGSPVERVSGLCLHGYTQNQLLRDIDAVSMAHSLEVRVPYLDPVVIDTALSLPDWTKLGDVCTLTDTLNATYRDTGAKRVLIDIGRELLPEGMDLQKKRGFGMPFDSWLKNPLDDVLEDTLSYTSVKKRGYFNAKEVEAIRNRFLAGEISWVFPWLLVITELWCREVLDRTPEYAVN